MLALGQLTTLMPLAAARSVSMQSVPTAMATINWSFGVMLASSVEPLSGVTVVAIIVASRTAS